MATPDNCLYEINWLPSSRTTRKGCHDVGAFPSWRKCLQVHGPHEDHPVGIYRLKERPVDHTTGLNAAGSCFVNEEHKMSGRCPEGWLFTLIRGVWFSGRQARKSNVGDNIPLRGDSERCLVP